MSDQKNQTFFPAFSRFSCIISSDSCASVFPGVLQGRMKITHLQHTSSLSGETAAFGYYSKQDFLLRRIHLEPSLFPLSFGQEVSAQAANGLLFFPYGKTTSKQTNKQAKDHNQQHHSYYKLSCHRKYIDFHMKISLYVCRYKDFHSFPQSYLQICTK